MNRSKNLLSIVFAAALHAQAPAGCDVPMFAAARLFRSAGGAQMSVTADFNQDGITDLAVTTSGSAVSVLLGNGDGTFQPAITHSVAAGQSWIGAADFNGDGNPPT